MNQPHNRKWKVVVQRTARAEVELEVEAQSKIQAGLVAGRMAPDIDFSGRHYYSNYDITDIQEVTPNNESRDATHHL